MQQEKYINSEICINLKTLTANSDQTVELFCVWIDLNH